MKLHSVYANKSNFLTVKGNSLIFLYNKSWAEKQISRQVQPVCGVFDFKILQPRQETELYKSTTEKQSENGVQLM